MREVKQRLSSAEAQNEIIKNTFFFHLEEDSVGIYRILYDVGEDPFGRSITAFEGIVSPRSYLRDFIMDIPNILLYLMQQDEIVDGFISEEHMSATVNIPDRINPFLVSEEEQAGTEFEHLPSGFRALIKDIIHGKLNGDFLLGPASASYQKILRTICSNIRIFNDDTEAEENTRYETGSDLMSLSQSRYLNGRIGITVRIIPKQTRKKEEKDERFEFQWVVVQISDEHRAITPLYSFPPVGMKNDHSIYGILNDLSYIDALLLYLGWIKVEEGKFIYRRVTEQ